MTFRKEERLCSRSTIDKLYSEGHRLMAFPFSVHWMAVDSSKPLCQVMIVAPKRKFRHAVDRNRVRRLVRECYRNKKGQLYEFLSSHGTRIALSMVYIHGEIMPFHQLEQKIDKLMLSLENSIAETSAS